LHKQLLFEIEIPNLMDLEKLVEKFFEFLEKEKKSTVSPILCLQGPMGVGKTEFVKALCKKLNLTGVSSPSFSIQQSYSNDQGITLYHVDLYRLKNTEDLESTGFWDLMSEDQSWLIIEWPERLDGQELPLHRPQYIFEFSFDTEKHLASNLSNRRVQVSFLDHVEVN